MKLSCVQMNMAFARPEENFRRAEALVRQAAGGKPDVIILPETWNTGFFPREDLASLCDRDCAQTRMVFGALAKELGVNLVAGSVANARGGRVYNTACVFDRNGELLCAYDKTHLFTPMGEQDFFTPGDHLCRFELDGVPCGILICYDIRFPELTRTMALEGMDLLFVVSQWPAVRDAHLRTLTTARAIENQMFLACCNSCGMAYDTVYGGNSAILDPLGETITSAGAEEMILTADCDFSQIEAIRRSIPVFHDRRPELY